MKTKLNPFTPFGKKLLAIRNKVILNKDADVATLFSDLLTANPNMQAMDDYREKKDE